MSREERSHSDNGIWLCQSCGRKIDSDPIRHSVCLLRQWKQEAEAWASNQLGKAPVSQKKLEMTEALLHRVSPETIADPVGTMAEITVATLERIDKRFRIDVERIAGVTSYKYMAVEPVSVELSVDASHAGGDISQRMDHFMRHGDVLELPHGTFSISGSPLFDELTCNATTIRMTQQLNKAASIILELVDTDAQSTFFVEITGGIYCGTETFSFSGGAFSGLIGFKVRFDPKNAKGSINISHDFACWNDKDVQTLPYFDRMWTYLLHVLKSGQIRMRLEVDGQNVLENHFHLQSEWGTQLLMLRHVRNVRTVAATLGIRLRARTTEETDIEEFKQAQELYARLQLAAPSDLSTNPILELGPLPGETVKQCRARIKGLHGVLSISIREEGLSLFGQEIPPILLEMIFSQATLKPKGANLAAGVRAEIVPAVGSHITCRLKLADEG